MITSFAFLLLKIVGMDFEEIIIRGNAPYVLQGNIAPRTIGPVFPLKLCAKTEATGIELQDNASPAPSEPLQVSASLPAN